MGHESRTWRTFLAELIAVPQEKRRIAHELGVDSKTLDRWVQGVVPRSTRILSRLLDTIPQERVVLTELIRRDPRFADFSPASPQIDHTPDELPVDFYIRLLETNATIAAPLRFRAITTLILQQSLQLLDREQSGLERHII